jgi:hypothetical protein
MISEALKSEMAAQVRNGVDYLEEKIGSWYNHINVGNLDMSSTTDDIAGQLQRKLGGRGNFWDFLVSLEVVEYKDYLNDDWRDRYISIAANFGLTLEQLTTRNEKQRDDMWDYLQELWIKQIAERKLLAPVVK